MAGVQRGERGEVKFEREVRGEREAQSLGSPYFFFFRFYVHQMKVKILIDQN